jgi:inorganic pyrophosphatase
VNNLLPYSIFVARHFQWPAWEALIARNGITIDRPRRSHHPDYPDIIYPIDYGFIDGTTSGDGQEVDVFVGSSETGLIGGILTTDHRKGDREMKLIYNCSPEEIYLVNGFVNFDPSLMQGVLVLRRRMAELWSTPGRAG